MRVCGNSWADTGVTNVPLRQDKSQNLHSSGMPLIFHHMHAAHE